MALGLKNMESKGNKRIIALIGARGGSKGTVTNRLRLCCSFHVLNAILEGLPRKNILPLNGIPMIGYSILAGKECPFVDEVFVSTEDEEIKQVSRQYGATIIHRPPELASDTATASEWVTHALKTLEPLPDYVVLLQPTSPLRTAQHITDCLEGFFNDPKKPNSLLSVKKAGHHPYKSFVSVNGEIQPILEWKYLSMNRQSLPESFLANGAIYVFQPKLFLDHGADFYVQPVKVWPMSEEDSHDVDTRADFEACESLLKKRTQ